MTTLSVTDCASREDAVKRFLDVIEKHGERIQATKRKIESIYRFRTPEEPFFSYDIENGNTYRPSRWVSCRSEYKLDTAMQQIEYNLEALPKTDYLPILSAHSGGIEFFPRLFGGEFETSDGGACLPKFFLVRDLSEDVDRIPEVDITKKESVSEALEDTTALLDYTGGAVCIAYPYMQGCFNNVYRFMDQEAMLIACIQEKEQMRRLLKKIYGVRAQILAAVRNRVGSDELLRVRGHGHHPAWVRSIVIDDFISVVRPEDYFDTCSEVWQQMSEDAGPAFLHTCGPISQCVDLYRRLPGLLASEFVYAAGQRKTTAQVEALKDALYEKVVLYSIGLPFGGVVDDPVNLTPGWIRTISSGGGIMLNGTGTLRQGRDLCETLEL